MSQTRTLGGDRAGSGNKMKIHTSSYSRSTHNLSRLNLTSMPISICIPVFKELMLLGDKITVDIDSMVRTLATHGAPFAKGTLRIHLAEHPIRLYNSWLHNNKFNIGDKKSTIKLPQIRITTKSAKETDGVNPNAKQIHPSSILHHLGYSGAGRREDTEKNVERDFNGLMPIMYVDFWKNYLANKQEGIGYVVDYTNTAGETPTITTLETRYAPTRPWDTRWLGYKISNGYEYRISGSRIKRENTDITATLVDRTKPSGEQVMGTITFNIMTGNITHSTLTGESRFAVGNSLFSPVNPARINITSQNNPTESEITFQAIIREDAEVDLILASMRDNALEDRWTVDYTSLSERWEVGTNPSTTEDYQMNLTEFPLENMDTMRENILKTSGGQTFLLDGSSNDLPQPWSAMFGNDDNGTSKAKYPLAGGLLTCYNSDRFQSWLNNEMISGENSALAAISTIDVSKGLNLDVLLVTQKIYNVLNQVVSAGNTFYDAAEIEYDETALKLAEIPRYLGGYRTTIGFSEVVATADSETNPLGSLAGRGTQLGKMAGKAGYTCREAAGSIVIAYAVITPDVGYGQGNHWITRLKDMADFHIPGHDGIGWQDLLTDEFQAADTIVDDSGIPQYKSIGKQIAWQEYTTATNEIHGQFVYGQEWDFMAWQKAYGFEDTMGLKDATSYIDPRIYNNIFRDASLTAENYWVLLGFDVKMRRKMKAGIPNY